MVKSDVDEVSFKAITKTSRTFGDGEGRKNSRIVSTRTSGESNYGESRMFPKVSVELKEALVTL